MIVPIGDKWIDTDTLTEIKTYDNGFNLYVTEKGNYIGAYKMYAGGTNPYFHITKETHPEWWEFAQCYTNLNEEDQL